MLTSEQVILICVVAGFIPYFIKRQHIKGVYVLVIRALFWSVQYTVHQLTIRIPLIERLRRVIWIVITHLYDDDGNHSQE